MAEFDKIEAGIKLAEQINLRVLAKIVLTAMICITVWALWERRTEVVATLLSSVSAIIIMLMLIVGLIAYLALDNMIREAEKRVIVVQQDMQSRLDEYKLRIEQQDKRIDALILEQAHDARVLQETLSTLAKLRRIIRNLIENGAIQGHHFSDSILGKDV